jgi:hypothetical protein
MEFSRETRFGKPGKKGMLEKLAGSPACRCGLLCRPGRDYQAAKTKGPLTAIGQLTARSLRIAAVEARRKATIELSMEVSITK